MRSKLTKDQKKFWEYLKQGKKPMKIYRDFFKPLNKRPYKLDGFNRALLYKYFCEK